MFQQIYNFNVGKHYYIILLRRDLVIIVKITLPSTEINKSKLFIEFNSIIIQKHIKSIPKQQIFHIPIFICLWYSQHIFSNQALSDQSTNSFTSLHYLYYSFPQMIAFKNILKLSPLTFKTAQSHAVSHIKHFIRDNKGQLDDYNSDFKYQRRTVTSDYWKKLEPAIQSNATNIIQMLLNSQTSKKQLIGRLQEYLEFRTSTFQKDVRTDLGCLAVLVALNTTTVQISLSQYQTRIIDFITLTDINMKNYDEIMLHYLMLGINKRTTSNIQKNIRQYYRLKYVQILIDNIDRIDDRDLGTIINHILLALTKDRYNFITKWRFYPLSKLILKRSVSLMNQVLSGKNLVKRQNERIINSLFLVKLFDLLEYYNISTSEEGNIIIQFLTTRPQLMNDSFNYMKVLSKAILKFPYLQLNQKGDTFLGKILAFYEQRFNSSAIYRTNHNGLYPMVKKMIVQRYFLEEFHRMYKSLPFEAQQDFKILRMKEPFKKPVIPQFIWRLYRLEEKTYLQKYILSDIISNLYPEKISSTYRNIKPEAFKNKVTEYSQNEFNFRVWQALKQLGVSYIKQGIRAERQVDLVLEDNILIELDGEGHYEPQTLQTEASTSFRNMHLLLRGYKVITISCFEYNHYRSIAKLTGLIKRKLQIIKQDGVVFVS